jgi:hypothetical protein
VNIYIVGFLVLCLVAGLWAPRKRKIPAIVLLLTSALVVFLTLFSSKL